MKRDRCIRLCLAILTAFILFNSSCLYASKTKRNEWKEFLVIKPLNANIGMFATFNLVLGHLHLYDRGEYRHLAGLMVHFGREGNYYDPAYGPNWWSYYFEPLELGSRHDAILQSVTESQNQNAWAVRRLLSRHEAYEIITKYVKVKPFIINKANQFASDNFGQNFVIGVHYRGTDKSSEAPRVPYEQAIQTIANQTEALGEGYRIFVATDEKAFLEHVQGVFPNKVVFIEAHRSSDASSVHHSDNDPYHLGEEALLDAVLLSKCNLLIRTSSSLSLWSTYYNPELPVIMLSQRYGNRPE